MSAKEIRSILDNAPELRTLTKHTRQLLDLQRLVREALPASLASRTFVAHLESGTLTIATDNGAAAAKIRQLVPRLLNKLRPQEPEVNAIRVQVQVTVVHKSLHKKRIFLDHNARDALLTLSARLETSPLKSALRRLADRATPSNYKQETLNKVNSYKYQHDNDSDDEDLAENT